MGGTKSPNIPMILVSRGMEISAKRMLIEELMFKYCSQNSLKGKKGFSIF